jgi:outer membrane protein assembly factor BamA
VYKRSDYEDFKFTQADVKEHLGSGSLAFGFLSSYFSDTKFVVNIGIDDLRYFPDPRPKEDLLMGTQLTDFQRILSRRFTPGTFAWISSFASQDFRNHPMHPSRGYQWAANGRVGIPGTSANVGFFKFDFDFSWYTPLINERDLVFCLHTHAGFTKELKNRLIPYRELYHIGGPSSVRGFLFGEIGPSFLGNTSIGGKNAFWLNAEMVFPINGAFTIKGAVFYDGGAGWNTPHGSDITAGNLLRNNFDYRHAVGFGIRLLNPTPVKLDWGFKLDRRKGEPASEAHLTMYHNF